MDPSTPAGSALHYVLEELRRLRGRPPKTWICIAKQQLKNQLNINQNEVLEAAKDKNCEISYVANIEVLS